MNIQKYLKSDSSVFIVAFMLIILSGIFPNILYADKISKDYKMEKTIKALTGNIYAKPDIKAPVIHTLKQGDLVTIIDNEGDWYIGKLPDKRLGWIFKDLFIEQDVQTPEQQKSDPKEDIFKAIVTVESGRVREEPTTQSAIKFSLKKGEIISVKEIQDKWYYIELEDSKTGWAYQGLFSRDIPKQIQGIRVEGSSDGDEKIIFTLNGFFPPKTFAYDDENNEPKVVCDFYQTILADGIDKSIPVGGKLVKKLRIGFHKSPEPKVRIVVDLDPDQKYGVEQVFYKKTNLYILTFKPVE
ncbi:SH3-like and AMIN domain-containing protein [Desulfonema limicola]|uniref:SH3-like and AMIN domain-containing protein n=1 Tax=Desulfonema limicola TaxID=45656 RepID=A0A975B5U7_9BACT|nr:SH3 domain-containing protein [Desulfonema limicola]QTA79338.1 SH3-like and AMIN domain-containing protein [Desulfonema limicola]